MLHRGSCHCGKVAFEVETDLEQVVVVQLLPLQPKGLPSDLRAARRPVSCEAKRTFDLPFNTHTIAHRFCATCGCAPFGEGKKPTGEATAAINVRCLETVDLAQLPTGVRGRPQLLASGDKRQGRCQNPH